MPMILFRVIYTSLFLLFFQSFLFGQYQTAYPDIPRIDVHTHMAEDSIALSHYPDLRTQLEKETGIDLALWLNLGNGQTPIVNREKVQRISHGRIASAIADYSAHDGLDIAPTDLLAYKKQGYAGYKIWSGPWYRKLEKKEDGYPYIDHPIHEATFAEMEKIGLTGASVHIADPNGPFGKRTPWLADPIEYWKEIMAWVHVLDRHPDLKVVMAHGNWLMCQDAQIDFLRYLLATYPGLHIDLAATFQYYDLVNPDNLRAFMVEWADRILFATDIGGWQESHVTQERIQQYIRAFQILETAELVDGSFFNKKPIQGLGLPREVLEKIYYKNALKIYPELTRQWKSLGYKSANKD